MIDIPHVHDTPRGHGIHRVHDTLHQPHYLHPTSDNKRDSCSEPFLAGLRSVPSSVWRRQFPGEVHHGCTRTGRVNRDSHNYDRHRADHHLVVCLATRQNHRVLPNVDTLLQECPKIKTLEMFIWENVFTIRACVAFASVTTLR